MMRSILIYLSKSKWAYRLVTRFGLARKTALRFVAGETLDEALEVTKQLNRQGMHATLDLLGEDTSNLDDARAAAHSIISTLEAIERTGVRSNVSIKLSQLGLKLDPLLCRKNLKSILQRASELNTFVRIDMEESAFVEGTLEMFREMTSRYHYDNVGVVIQSYLYRSSADVKKLMGVRAHVRLVKGAYMEPPEIAFPDKSDVDRCFDEITKALLDGAAALKPHRINDDGKIPPMAAIASHDEYRVAYAKKYAHSIGLPKEMLEFQFLYGIRVRMQRQLVREGYPVRIYVPFGEQWFPYFMRRLAERPANVWFFITSLFSR